MGRVTLNGSEIQLREPPEAKRPETNPNFPGFFFVINQKRPWGIRLVDWESASGIALWSTKMTHKGIHMLCKAELQIDNCIACLFFYPRLINGEIRWISLFANALKRVPRRRTFVIKDKCPPFFFLLTPVMGRLPSTDQRSSWGNLQRQKLGKRVENIKGEMPKITRVFTL